MERCWSVLLLLFSHRHLQLAGDRRLKSDGYNHDSW